jgi:hypothetical protein
MRGISKVIAMHAYGARFRHNRQLVREPILLGVIARSESQEVLGNGDIPHVFIGGSVGYFVEKLLHF